MRDIGLAGGSVSGIGYNVGGLAGENDGTIIGAWSSTTITATSANAVGGLVGDNEGTITGSYATGSVSGDTYVGGLAGYNAGTIANAYAIGAVKGVYYVGGLVGYNYSAKVISDVFATGAVIGTRYVGGLVGENDGTISRAYAIGAVSGTGSYFGGLVGYNYSSGTVSNSYWDTETTGRSSSSGGGTALTTAQLQDGSSASGLGSAFTLTSGLYPYLTSFFPDGVQAISGTAYKDAGTTVAASGSSGAVTVTAIAGGTTFGTATTGANGYYYIFAAAGTFSSGDSLLAYTTANATTGAANATTLGTATSAALYSGFDLYGGMLAVMTDAATLSSAPDLSSLKASALAAAGSDTAAATAINATSGQGIISSVDFTIDQTLDVTGTLLIATAAGKALTIAEDVDIETGASLTLSSGGLLSIDAPVTVRGAGAVALAYDTSDAANLTFASGGSLTYANADGSTTTSSQGGTLSINGDAYTLLYSMAELASLPTSTIASLGIEGYQGNYALAVSLDASGVTYADALIGAGTTLYGDGDYHPFVGIFEGLGHTITGLTIVKSGDYAGLFGANGGGTIRDIGLINASVSGEDYVGSLAGFNSGTIVNAYATGTVSTSSSSSWDVGGLVGVNYEGGIIVSSYAASTVSGSWYVGGLVGANYGGTITDSYATGDVSGSTNVGGLAGINLDGTFVDATITDAYATGAVNGTDSVGGLVGWNAASGKITNGYWDTETSGQSSGIGTDSNGQSVTALTTAEFQDGASATGLGSAFTLTSGLFPYLTGLFPNGVQAVSGYAYTDTGSTPLISGSNGAGVVTVVLDGVTVITATTGANGYYYAFFASGGIDTTSGSSVLAYTTANASTGATNASTSKAKATGSLTDFNIYSKSATGSGTVNSQGFADVAALASTFIRIWPINTPEVALPAPSGTLSMNFSDNGSEAFSSLRFDGAVVCRGDGNCGYNIPAAKD